MQLTPPYLETDYDDSDDPPSVEVPGLDDCDYIYSLSSRSGHTSVYIKVHECLPGKFYAELIVDSSAPEGDNFATTIPGERGPFRLPEHACAANLEDARAWFRSCGLAFVYCTDSRRVAKKYNGGRVACILGEINPNPTTEQ
jgi:hypothetical protein